MTPAAASWRLWLDSPASSKPQSGTGPPRVWQGLLQTTAASHLLLACPLTCKLHIILPPCSLSHTEVTGAGLQRLSSSHAKQLARLQIDGCRVSTWALLSMLRRQPRGSCMWDAQMRGHLPR